MRFRPVAVRPIFFLPSHDGAVIPVISLPGVIPPPEIPVVGQMRVLLQGAVGKLLRRSKEFFVFSP